MEKMTTLQKTTDCGLLRTIRWIFMAVMALILLLLHDEASFMLAAIVPMAAAFALCIYIYIYIKLSIWTTIGWCVLFCRYCLRSNFT